MKYQDEARAELVMEPDKGALFLTDYGEGFQGDPLSNLVKRYLKKQALPRQARVIYFAMPVRRTC
ncbi:MAG: hypothetical protein GXP21_01650 [Gammaproteobacteria bacterium]|nr:hypothetical protein [Gammaproteobacteria bacterium]